MNPLLEPATLGNLELKNRIAMAPLTRARAGAERIPNALMAEYYTQRSSVGLIISEATTVSPQGNGWNHSPGIYTDEMIEGWKLTTSAVYEQGEKFSFSFGIVAVPLIVIFTMDSLQYLLLQLNLMVMKSILLKVLKVMKYHAPSKQKKSQT